MAARGARAAIHKQDSCRWRALARGQREEEGVYFSVLVKAFNGLGYAEGKNIHLDHRFPNENPDRFRTLAQELVGLRPDAIITTNTLGTADVKRVTATIPICLRFRRTRSVTDLSKV